MKVIVQRVLHAKVKVGRRVVGTIGHGFLIYVGITHTDKEKEADALVQKLIHLRIMPDSNKKMNLSIQHMKGSILVISQFTLYADTSSRRPGFMDAAKTNHAKTLYDYFIMALKKTGLTVATGEFGAYMQVFSVNDGPVTITLEV